MSSRIWTNDTRRDEDKKRSPRAEATAARYEGQKHWTAGTSNPGQTRACFTAVQTKRAALPVRNVCPYIVRFTRSTFLRHGHACVHACIHAYNLYVLLCTLCKCAVNRVRARRPAAHTHQTDRDQSACFGCHTKLSMGLPPSILPASLTDWMCPYACMLYLLADQLLHVMACVAWMASMASWRVVVVMSCDTLSSPWSRVVPFLGQSVASSALIYRPKTATH